MVISSKTFKGVKQRIYISNKVLKRMLLVPLQQSPSSSSFWIESQTLCKNLELSATSTLGSSLSRQSHPPWWVFKNLNWDFPGGPVVKNRSCKAGDAGLISRPGTKIPHAMGQLSPHAATTEPTRSGAHASQLERSLCTATKSPHTTTKDPTCCN